jgi:hypothetical protein
VFTVTLDNDAVNADYDVTATRWWKGGRRAVVMTPEDYDNAPITLHFVGNAGESHQFTVATLDDGPGEGNETFQVNLSASNPLVDDSDTATGTITEAASNGSISGVKFHDQDGDGIKDAEEPGLQGWTIFLDTNANGILDAGEVSQETLSDGSYTFTGLAAGTYWVAEVIQSGWVPTLAAQVPVTVASSNDPTDIALADIDRDGDLDALVVVPASNAVVRVANDGLGGFTRLTTVVNVGGSPLAIAVGDFDGVNGPDLATANSAGNTISVKLNNGSGEYLTGSSINLDTGDGHEQPLVVAAGRFAADSDVDLDLFTALGLDDSWRVYANDGSGAFTFNISAWPLFVDWPRDTAVGDFDGDGRDDVALVYLNSDNVLIVLNGATGLSSAGARRISVGDVPAGIAVADFDGDSNLDFVTANRDSSSVTVVLNQGSADFAAGVTYAAGTMPLHVAAGDFNRDGFPDIIVANRDTDSVSLLMNRGNGTFAARLVFNAGDSPETVAVADLNGDGVDDVLVLNKLARTLSVLLSTGGGQAVNLTSGQAVVDVNLGNRRFQAPSVTVRQSGGTTTAAEGGTGDTYEIFLNTVPTADVTVTVTPDSQIDLGAGPGVAVDLLFAPANGTEPKTVQVTAADDLVPEGAHAGSISHSASSTDGDYHGIAIDTVTVNITDNDNFLPTISDIADQTIAEEGTTGALTFTVGDVETAAAALVMTGSSSNPALVPDANIVFGGSGTNRTVTVTPLTNQFGTATITVTVTDADGGWAADTFLLTVTETQSSNLIVTALTPTSTGFQVRFSQDLDAGVLNLYDQGGTLGPADLTLTGVVTGKVRGSFVIGPGLREATFITTIGLLPPDQYTVTLTSGATAFRDSAGSLLDGDEDGTPGGDFEDGFTVSAPATNAVTISLPNVTRGYGQPVNLPANVLTAGLPLTISNGLGVTRVELKLRYDPSLLTITAFTLAGIVESRPAQRVLDTSTPGVAVLTITAATGLADIAGPLIVGSFTAQVPNNAPYAGKHVLDITDLRVLDNSPTPVELPAIGDDAVHVAAFLGDGNGGGGYDSPDATLVRRIIGQLNTGLLAYQLADPRLIVDVTGNGYIQANDTTNIRRVNGLASVPYIPALPSELTMPTARGADPRVYIPRGLAGAPGETVTVPVMIEVTEPAGVTIGGFDLVVEYDAERFAVSQAKLGDLFHDSDVGGTMTQPALGKLFFSADSLVGTRRFPTGTVGTLVTLKVAIAADAAPGTAAWNLLASLSSSRTGVYDADLEELVLNPPPTNEPDDVVDGVLLVGGGLPTWHNTANPFDVNADGLVSALDGLILINYLNAAAGGGWLPAGASQRAMYGDVNDDSLCTAQDVWAVVSRLNTGVLPVAEREHNDLEAQIFHDLERELSPLEGVLGDLADDVASAWR